MSDETEPQGDYMRVIEGASFDYQGQPVVLCVGDTVRRGHPMMAGRMHLVEDFQPTYDFEEQRSSRAASQPVRAPASPVRADQRGARPR